MVLVHIVNWHGPEESVDRAVLIPSASSILVYKLWVYRKGFERHSYKTSLLTDFFFFFKENKARNHCQSLTACEQTDLPVWMVSGGFTLSEGNGLSFLAKV